MKVGSLSLSHDTLPKTYTSLQKPGHNYPLPTLGLELTLHPPKLCY